MALSFGKKPDLIAYVTCGDPDLDTTREIVLAAIDAGASVIELGVPFSDPIADGPVIQRASKRALESGTTIDSVIRLAREIRSRSPVGLIVFSYLNPILKMGLAKFAKASHDAGLDGALVTDLPAEEAENYLSEMQRQELATVFLAAPTSTDERLRAIAKTSSGFIYAVSRTGVTGAQQQMASDAQKLVGRLRKYSKLPIAVGFGVSTSQQFAAVGTFADAAVVGSAIVEIIERNPRKESQAVAKFVRELVARN